MIRLRAETVCRYARVRLSCVSGRVTAVSGQPASGPVLREWTGPGRVRVCAGSLAQRCGGALARNS